MNKNNESAEIYKIMKNVRDDIIKNFSQVSVAFRVSWGNAPFYRFDTNGSSHRIAAE